MNVFAKITLQSIKRNRARTIATIIGVILSVALIMAVTSFISSFQNFLIQEAITVNGDWHAEIMDADYALVQDLEANKEVKSIALVNNLGFALPDGWENGHNPHFYLLGLSDEAFDMLPVRLTEGRLPQNTREILIPEQAKKEEGFKYNLGDTLTLNVGHRMYDGKRLDQNDSYHNGHKGIPAESLEITNTESYTIVGFCTNTINKYFPMPNYLVVTKAGQTTSGSYDVYLKLHSARKTQDFLDQYSAEYSNSLTTLNSSITWNSSYLQAMGAIEDDAFITTMYSLGGVLIVLIIVSSILLIYNSFSISISERTRQLGILSSVGATRKQLRKSVLFEGVCIGSIGIPLGILAGVGIIGVTLKTISSFYKSTSSIFIPITLSVSPVAIIVTIVGGIAVILISAFIPALRASKRPAIESIRQTDDINIKARAVKTSRLTSRLFGLPGVLASKNFKRNKKRYRATVISLSVSIVLLVSASTFGMFLKREVETSLNVQGFDIQFTAYQMNENEFLRLYEKLKATSEISNSGYYLNTNYLFKTSPDMVTEQYKNYNFIKDDESNSLFISSFNFTFIDNASYLRYLQALKMPVDKHTGKDAILPAIMKADSYNNEQRRPVSFDIFKEKKPITLYIEEFENSYFDEPENTQVTIQPYEFNKTLTLTPTDIAPTGFSDTGGFVVFAPYSLKDQFVLSAKDDDWPTAFFMSNEPLKSVAEMKNLIQEEGVTENQYSLYSRAEEQAAELKFLSIINVGIYAFVILIALIAIANVFNTISTSINLRRREFAMLRSVGMNNRSFNKMMNYECLFYGFKALLYGLPISLVISFLVYKICTHMNPQVDSAFILPWAGMGTSILCVFFVVFVTMLYSLSKLKKKNTVDALRNDML